MFEKIIEIKKLRCPIFRVNLYVNIILSLPFYSEKILQMTIRASSLIIQVDAHLISIVHFHNHLTSKKNIYLLKFSTQTYVVVILKNCLAEAVLFSPQNLYSN